MQCSPDRNAGFSRANPQQLHLPVIIDPEYHYEAVNVENQQKNLSSLLWWMRRVIATRKNFKAFSRGSLEFLHPDNARVLVFLRRHENETIIVVVNLSRFAQAVRLDLSLFSGCVPIEVFSRNPFPSIKKSPYILTLGPHSHYWFVLQPQAESRRLPKKRTVPTLRAPADLRTLLADGERARFEEEILPRFIGNCRWFGAKARTLRHMRVHEQSPVSNEPDAAQIWFVEVSYLDGPDEIYALPVKIVSGDMARAISQTAPHAVIARFEDSEETILFDAVWDSNFREQIFRIMLDEQRASGKNGHLVGTINQTLAPATDKIPASSVIPGG